MERTPLLVPSFSSKGFPDVAKIIETTQEVIEGPTLVSAYDLHYGRIQPPFDFASLIFLDSGGYEASKDTDLAEIGDYEHRPKTWEVDFHKGVLKTWSSTTPTVVISYDNPSDRMSVVEQVSRALKLVPTQSDVLREILLKPETPGQRFLQMDQILAEIKRIAKFDIVGVTEKEVGSSILSRMENIAQLRMALDKVRPDIPIHVFGSLDTVTTPMYFLAGADIFDGLTWLRFAYHQGYTVYKQNYGAIELSVKTGAHLIDGRCWFQNYHYLIDMQLEMRRFLTNRDFGVFKYHGNLFKQAYESLIEAIGGEHGR